MATKYTKRREDFKLAPLGWEWDSEDEEEESNTGCEIPDQPTRLAVPKTLDDVQQAKGAAMLKGNSRDMQLCVKLWKTCMDKRETHKPCQKILQLCLTMLYNNIYLFSS